jgi:endonuclease/exonuclease/phosphatase family metal-dependent hydrolase
METLRAVTLNLWGEQPPLEARMAGAVAELERLAPDVVALQEVRQVPGVVENQAAVLARRFGWDHRWALATPWGGGEEGLAILSRHSITFDAAHELPGATPDERRILLHATIATPAGPVHVFTTHLNYRLAHGLIREAQVVAAEKIAAAAAEPSTLPTIWMGDFNATPDSDEMRFLRGLTTLDGRRVYWEDAWLARHRRDPEADGWTWARRNPQTGRLGWLALDRRIDYVYVTPERRDGRGAILDCELCFDRPDADGVYPSDHFGLVATIRLR